MENANFAKKYFHFIRKSKQFFVCTHRFVPTALLLEVLEIVANTLVIPQLK